VLLHRQIEDDAQVLVLRGPVAAADAAPLRAAVDAALGGTSRGVVVDLCGADAVAGAAVDALAAVAERSGGWPRPSLAVCGAPTTLAPRLEPLLTVHRDRHEALAHLDDVRPDGTGTPRREVVVEHGPCGPRQARHAVQRWAADVELGPLTDDLLLIVSELVTNAVRYGSPPVRVAVSADDHVVTVGVVDGAGALRPVSRDAPDDAESGRGLLLLSLLSQEHGVRADPPGKVVWATLPR
jgi:anti-sigma regulatory factor (Ser/Thr protein kinase)